MKEGWQVVGTVGLEEGNSQSNNIPCSDFKMSKPTLLLMGTCSNLCGPVIAFIYIVYVNVSVCVLSGGEGGGLSPELRQLCDVLITIPPRRHIHPGVESLNVSVATGMLF